MIRKLKTSRDNKQICTAIETDLSKAFDCIGCDLLIAKLNVYGFDKKALKLIYDYLKGLRNLKWTLYSVVSYIFLMVFEKDPCLLPCYLI